MRYMITAGDTYPHGVCFDHLAEALEYADRVRPDVLADVAVWDSLLDRPVDWCDLDNELGVAA